MVAKKIMIVSVDGENLDHLWLSMIQFKQKSDRPSLWNGFMQSIMKGSHPGISGVMYLPFIDLPASNETCIYSTLNFVAEQAMQCGVVPVITFDQPLYWKARKLIENAPKESLVSSVVVRIGGFHTLMSYLGCIGHLMEGSGLEEIMQLIYAQDTVPHILSGKAYARASRAHLIISSALYLVLFSELFGCNEDNIGINQSEREELRNLYERIKDGSYDVFNDDALNDSFELNKFKNIIRGKHQCHS